MVQGHHGVTAWGSRPDYQAYKSPYGPDYKMQPHIRGIGVGRGLKFATTAGAFGAVAGIFALFFFSDVPKVKHDIMEKLPVIGDYFHKEIPPSDNPF